MNSDDRDDRLDETGHERAPNAVVAKAARTSRSSATSSSTSGAAAPVDPKRSTAASSRRGIPVNSSVPSRKRATATSSAAISAADARGPRRPASRAIRRAGNRAFVGSPEVEPAGRDEVGRRGRRWPPVGIGQRVLDRKSHVRGAQLGLEGAVHEPDGGVDDALRVDDHLDRVVVDIVQPVGLDDLQALVGERRRVDRDLGAHRPGRVAERLGGRDRGELLGRRIEERTARCGQDQARDRGHRLADEALPDRRVLRVDRAEPGQRAGVGIAWVASPRPWRPGSRASGITRWPPATSVSLLAVATTFPARRAASTGRRLTTPPVATMTRSTSSRVASASSASCPPTRAVSGGEVQAGQRRLVAERDGTRPQAAGLLGEQRRHWSRPPARRP